MKAEEKKIKNPAKRAKNRQGSMGAAVKSELIAWFWVIFVFLLINGTIAQARVIPSGSMEKTLLIGDHLIMSRVGYDAGIPFTNLHVPLWKNPKRQQIIIFRPPYGKNQVDLIKRVVALPGETIDVHGGAVWINGKRLLEDYTTGPTQLPTRSELLPEFKGLPATVPAGNYFVMGDNRGNSYDSRFWGFVPRENILGTPVTIYMSVAAPEEAWNGGLRDRLLAYASAVVHPSRVRWNRLFEIFR